MLQAPTLAETSPKAMVTAKDTSQGLPGWGNAGFGLLHMYMCSLGVFLGGGCVRPRRVAAIIHQSVSTDQNESGAYAGRRSCSLSLTSEAFVAGRVITTRVGRQRWSLFPSGWHGHNRPYTFALEIALV
jgi:hypothetical protein